MKKSRLASILVLILLSCSIFAQQKTKQFDPNEGTGKVPKLVILKTDHDFGKIDKTQKVTAQFKFKNEGDGILQIKDVKTSCGCTAAKPDKRVYHPGEEGEVSVTFNPARFQGPITKTVTILSNDPEQPDYRCKIKADIIVDIIVKPRVLFIQNLKRGETRTEKITIYTERLPKLEISDLKCDKNFIKYKMERVDDKKVNFLITVSGADIPKDQKRVFGNLSYKTNSKSQAQIKTRVHVTIQDPVDVHPPAIYFFGSKKGFAREISLRVRSTIGKELKLSDASIMINEAEFRGKITVTIDGDQKTGLGLKVKLLDTAPKGKFMGKISVKTNFEEQPMLIIPIKGSVI